MRLDPLADYSRLDANVLMAEIAAAGSRVWQDPETNAFYVVRYDDVVGLLNSNRLTTRRLSENQRSMSAGDHGVRDEMRSRFARWPLFSDGEYHERLRAGLAGVFKDPEGRALDRVATLVAKTLPTDGQPIDWVATVAEPLAVEVLALVLGVETAEAREVARLGVPVIDSLAMPLKDREHMAAAVAGMDGLAEWLQRRLREPATAATQSPLLAALAAITKDPHLGPDAASGALAQVVTGAFDPLTAAAVVLGLTATPRAQTELSVRDLVEEALRLCTPFRFARRFALEPIDLAGVRIPRDALILLCLGSANLDAERFGCPHQAAAGRPAHAAFSRGTHYCPGAELVRGGLTALATSLTEARLAFQPTDVLRARELNILRFVRVSGSVARY